MTGGRWEFPASPPADAVVIDGTGKILLPGLYDLHAHLREPGREDSETIATGTEAALAGGFTGLTMMPDTIPPVDNGGMVQSLLEIAARTAHFPVQVAGCVTKARDGRELAEIGEMRSRGAVMITDDPDPVANPQVLRRALQYSRDLGVLIATTCDVRELSGQGAMHDGSISYRLGLPGLHPCAEEIGIARDIRLAQSCGARIHIRGVSTARSVETIRRYKSEGVAVTAEAAPHHLIFTDESVGDYDTSFKVKPPLRPETDRQALLQAVRDGVIDILATDHTPCTWFEKTRDFGSAPFGMTGLATALPALHDRLISKGELTWEVLVERFSAAPRRLLGLEVPVIEAGAPVNAILFDPEKAVTFTPENLKSPSLNTPFLNQTLTGAVIWAALGDRVLLSL
ncbi:MAG: dihydroorotase [Verrucomicrobiota bacterium]